MSSTIDYKDTKEFKDYCIRTYGVEHPREFAPDDEPVLQPGQCVCGALSVLLNTLVILQDTNMRTDRIHSLKNLTKLGEADMEAIRQRIIDIENLDDEATWTESGLNELSFYDIDLYRDVPGGAVHFIGGAMATLHRINGPHLI